PRFFVAGKMTVPNREGGILTTEARIHTKEHRSRETNIVELRTGGDFLGFLLRESRPQGKPFCEAVMYIRFPCASANGDGENKNGVYDDDNCVESHLLATSSLAGCVVKGSATVEKRTTGTNQASPNCIAHIGLPLSRRILPPA